MQVRSLLPQGYRQVQSDHGGHRSYFGDKFNGKALRPGDTGVTHKRWDGDSAKQLGLKESNNKRTKVAIGREKRKEG